MIATRNGSVRLFRLFGIDVFLHWSWAVVAIIQISSREGEYQQPMWKAVEYISLFAIVLMHEFGHALACKSVGGRAHDIVLWPLGGVAYVSPPNRPGAYLWSIAAGPLVNVILVPITIATYVVCVRFGLAHNSDVRRFLFNISIINTVLLIFNILPIFPLDGGQMLRGVLWLMLGAGRSLMIAAGIGVVVAGCSVLVALFYREYWLTIMALFAASRSWAGIQSARAIRMIETAPSYQWVRCPRCGKNPPAGPWWHCICNAPVDPFANGPICPFCGRSVEPIFCPHCYETSPLALWQPPAYPPGGQFPMPPVPPPMAPYPPYRASL
jgi:Zn-dependent protease